MDFLTLKPVAFGIDISDFSLKVAKLEKRKGFFHLAMSSTFSIKPGVISAGEIKDENTLAEIIRDAVLRTKNLATKYVVASLPEEKAFLQVIQLPKMKMAELQKAVYFEAENYIPLPIKDVYLDFAVIKPVVNKLDHVDVLLAAFPKNMVDGYMVCLEKAGLKPIALEIESLAISRALIKNEFANEPLLLLDLGTTRTGFIIFSGYSVRFTASIPVSGQNLSQAVSKVLGIDQEKAEQLKIKYGLERKTKEGRTVFEALIPSLTDLVEQIKKYLEYYKSHASHEHLQSGVRGVARVYLCGGGANLKGFDSFLASELKIPVELGNPWVNILSEPLKEVPMLPYKESLQYATALGLALRGIT